MRGRRTQVGLRRGSDRSRLPALLAGARALSLRRLGGQYLPRRSVWLEFFSFLQSSAASGCRGRPRKPPSYGFLVDVQSTKKGDDRGGYGTLPEEPIRFRKPYRGREKAPCRGSWLAVQDFF